MEFDSPNCHGLITSNPSDATMIVHGQFRVPVDGGSIHYLAAAPVDQRQTFTGSGLPFASKDQAFEGTPNQGSVQIDATGAFSFTIQLPNSYYADFNGTLIAPEIELIYITHGQTNTVVIPLGEAVGYRSLTWQRSRCEKDQMFYGSGWTLPVRTQEQVLRSSAYTVVENPSFWGLKPPQ